MHPNLGKGAYAAYIYYFARRCGTASRESDLSTKIKKKIKIEVQALLKGDGIVRTFQTSV